jgi:hypothetical protein
MRSLGFDSEAPPTGVDLEPVGGKDPSGSGIEVLLDQVGDGVQRGLVLGGRRCRPAGIRATVSQLRSNSPTAVIVESEFEFKFSFGGL